MMRKDHKDKRKGVVPIEKKVYVPTSNLVTVTRKEQKSPQRTRRPVVPDLKRNNDKFKASVRKSDAASIASLEEDKENLAYSKRYRDILQQCLQQRTRFEDEDFPATNASLFRSNKTKTLRRQGEEQFMRSAQSITRWQRPDNIRANGEGDWVLIDEPKPSDICQGELGNCWFVAALSLIAERKDVLAKILISSDVNSVGVYAIRLFKDGTWRNVIIDDYLPCDSFHRLVFSSCQRKQLWVPLIEKAMAKLHGSYESLQSGSIWDGLNYLTGFVSERIFLVRKVQTYLKLMFRKKSEEDYELLWGRLLSFYSTGFLMGATISTTSSAERIFEEKGLVANHVYSVLKVIAYEKLRLIQLRNPWGRFSWNGNWSDNSTKWTSELRHMFLPNQSDEGIFWMSYQDFMKYFTCIDICRVRQGWKSYTIDGILPPYADQDCQPCFQIKCKASSCEVDISIYQSSKRNSREIIKLTDIGFMVFELEETGSTKNLKLKQPIELAKSAKRRCVTTTLLIKKGRYCVVPYSFGHWTTEENKETYYAFTLTIHASRDISCFAMPPANFPFILADAFILCANKFGKRKRYSTKGKYDDISTISLNLGVGYCTIVENGSRHQVELQMESRTNENYVSTRNTEKLYDKIPPCHSQVVQVLTAKDPRKSSRISNTYQLQLLDDQPFEPANANANAKLHVPTITSRISGLHSPRPLT